MTICIILLPGASLNYGFHISLFIDNLSADKLGIIGKLGERRPTQQVKQGGKSLRKQWMVLKLVRSKEF